MLFLEHKKIDYHKTMCKILHESVKLIANN